MAPLFDMTTGTWANPAPEPEPVAVPQTMIGGMLSGVNNFAKAGEKYTQDLGLLKLLSQMGANMGGKGSMGEAIGVPVSAFVSNMAQTKGNQAGIAGQPAAPQTQAQPAAPQTPEQQQANNVKKAINAALEVQPAPQMGQVQTPSITPQASVNPPTTSAVTSQTGTPAEVVAPVPVPVSVPVGVNPQIQRLGEMVAAGPLQTGDPFESVHRISPWEMGAAASPEAVDTVFKNTIAAATQRHLARQEGNVAYKNIIDAYKESVMAGKVPLEMAKLVEEVNASREKRSGQTAQNEEAGKKAAELEAKNIEIETQARLADGTPLPAAALSVLKGSGVKTMGDLYRQFRTTDPKLLNDYIRDYVSLENGTKNADAIAKTSIAALVPFYNSQINNLRGGVLKMAGKVVWKEGETDSQYLARAILNKDGALQPAEVGLIASAKGQLDDMESKASNLAAVLEGSIPGTKNRRERTPDASSAPPTTQAAPTLDRRKPTESRTAGGKPVLVQGGYVFSVDGTLIGKLPK